jgi:hypothetical protein
MLLKILDCKGRWQILVKTQLFATGQQCPWSGISY